MRTKVFYGILVVLMGSLILFGKCRAWGGEVYGPGGEIAGYTLEPGNSDPIYQIPPSASTVIPDDITALLRECLEYIPDSSVIYNDSADSDNYLANGTLAIYRLRSAQTDADETADEAQAQANRVRDMADRLRAMTALHGKIKEMIGKLEQK